jgi:transposase
VNHVAIDLGSRESQICVRAADGTLLTEARWPTRSLAKYLSKLPASRVVMETCAEAFQVADVAQKSGHEVVVVPGMLVRALGVGARGLKNDVRDARNLSEASCRMAKLPSVHIPSARSRELKAVCGMRDALVGARTKLVNTVRGWLRGQALGRLSPGCVLTFPRRIKALLERQERPLPAFVARQLETIDLLTQQVLQADRELEKDAKGDSLCRRLMSVPGVGPVTALRFLAAIDEIQRFPHAHAVGSYLGLTPGEDSSSEKQRTTSITKAGAKHLRWCLVQAAWTIRRTRKDDPISQWAKEIEGRRGKAIATVAVARKIAGILFALWRDGTTYQANKAAAARPTQAPAPVTNATV